MPISEPEWESIAAMAERVVKRTMGSPMDFFVTGKVIKVDKANKCIYMREFGDQPIPIVGFEYEVKYYDQTPQGTTAVSSGQASPYRTITKTVKVALVMPKVGDKVLVAREMGTSSMPRALGVLLGKKWVIPEVDE